MTARDVELLSDRIHATLRSLPISTKRMFGGITFLLRGNMLCCASSKGLMVRVGAAGESEALKSRHASSCMGAGRPMAGFLMIDFAGIDRDEDLDRWIRLAHKYVDSLPAKEPKGPSQKKSPIARKRKAIK